MIGDNGAVQGATVTMREKATITEVLSAVIDERCRQDAKRGPLESRPLGLGDWLTVLRCELREAEEAWTRGRGEAIPAALAEVIQVAAVCVACLEQHGLGRAG